MNDNDLGNSTVVFDTQNMKKKQAATAGGDFSPSKHTTMAGNNNNNNNSNSNNSKLTKSGSEKRPKRMDPALRVITGRNRLQGSVSQLNTPAADFTPFHSPADPAKLNSDGPNWHLFNKKVTDSLEQLSQLKIQQVENNNMCSRAAEKKHSLGSQDS
eukprot:gene18603-20474_t